jgi:hypothetical protein
LTGFVAVFLVRGFAKVRGEWSLMALCYNFSRVLSILGFDRWLAVLAVRTRNPRGMLFLALATVPRQLSRFAAAICRAFQAVSMVQLHGATALRVDIVANILHFLPSLELLPSREVLYPLHSHRGADDKPPYRGRFPPLELRGVFDAGAIMPRVGGLDGASGECPYRVESVICPYEHRRRG